MFDIVGDVNGLGLVNQFFIIIIVIIPIISLKLICLCYKITCIVILCVSTFDWIIWKKIYKENIVEPIQCYLISVHNVSTAHLKIIDEIGIGSFTWNNFQGETNYLFYFRTAVEFRCFLKLWIKRSWWHHPWTWYHWCWRYTYYTNPHQKKEEKNTEGVKLSSARNHASLSRKTHSSRSNPIFFTERMFSLFLITQIKPI